MAAMLGWLSDGEELRLALEAGEPLGVLRHLGGQHLEGHLAPELRVGGAVDLAHAARAERGGDPVVRERLADQGRSPPGLSEGPSDVGLVRLAGPSILQQRAVGRASA